jgi:hypothetical protein
MQPSPHYGINCCPIGVRAVPNKITLLIVKVKNQLVATKYAVLLPQHVSGTNMPIIRSTINEYLPLLGGHTWKAAWVGPERC